MKQSEAYDLLLKEYLSKCRESGCDGCVAEIYCIENHLRKDRYPQYDCHEKLKKYFQSKCENIEEVNIKMEATNYEFLRTLSKEEFAHIFAKLSLDTAEESDWLEWMDKPFSKDEWEQILK